MEFMLTGVYENGDIAFPKTHHTEHSFNSAEGIAQVITAMIEYRKTIPDCVRLVVDIAL